MLVHADTIYSKAILLIVWVCIWVQVDDAVCLFKWVSSSADMMYCGGWLKQSVQYYAKSWLPARAIVMDCIVKRKEADSTGEIMVLKHFCPVRVSLSYHYFPYHCCANSCLLETLNIWYVLTVTVVVHDFCAVEAALSWAWGGVKDRANHKICTVRGNTHPPYFVLISFSEHFTREHWIWFYLDSCSTLLVWVIICMQLGLLTQTWTLFVDLSVHLHVLPSWVSIGLYCPLGPRRESFWSEDCIHLSWQWWSFLCARTSCFFLLLQDDRSKGWRVQAVAVAPGRFESRLPLPAVWRGLRDEELSKESGIEGGVFVHMSGFIGGNKTFEGALAMAKVALIIQPQPT